MLSKTSRVEMFVFLMILLSHTPQTLGGNATQAKPLYTVEKGVPETCPPEEVVHPCRCVAHLNSIDIVKTMLVCNQTDVSRSGLHSIEHVLKRMNKKLAKSPERRYFDWLYLVDLGSSVHKLSKGYFSGIRFSNLVVGNAPNLKYIHPTSLKAMNHLLRYFYAYNTGLEHYRSTPFKSPFGSMQNLSEVHIVSARNICPPKELIFPCECNIQARPLMPFNIERHLLQLRCSGSRSKSLNITRIFHRLTELTRNTNQTTWYFDELILRNVTQLESNCFGEVTFGELYVEASPLLTYLPLSLFSRSSLIQKLRISEVNFASDRLSQTFESINRLRFLRSLYIWSTSMEYIPENAFPNWQLYLKEIVLYGNNIRAIGSYAFANLPALDELSIDGNDLLLIDKYAFATNYHTTRPLRLSLASNNLRESSFTFMSLNGAQRPLHVSFAESGGCFWEVKHLAENVFAPFLDGTDNRIFLEPECQLTCQDCRMRWLVEAPRHVQKRIGLSPRSSNRARDARPSNLGGYVPCEESANLFDIHEYIDWNVCSH